MLGLQIIILWADHYMGDVIPWIVKSRLIFVPYILTLARRPKLMLIVNIGIKNYVGNIIMWKIVILGFHCKNDFQASSTDLIV